MLRTNTYMTLAAWGALLLLTGSVVASTAGREYLHKLHPDYPGIAEAPIASIWGDAPAGWGGTSWAAGGEQKTMIYFTPEFLFPHYQWGPGMQLQDLASISYWTKKAGAQGAPDWYFIIYTQPYGGGWYGNRIIGEPLYSDNIDAPADQWNQWSSDSDPNRLRFYDGPDGEGSYTDPFLAYYTNEDEFYYNQEIKYFTLSTASGWAEGFDGQIDGLEIRLTDGSVAYVDFAAVPLPAAVWGGLALLGGLAAAKARALRRR